MEFVQLPASRPRPLMRDMWSGAAGRIKRATEAQQSDVPWHSRTWVCLYDEDEREDYKPLLSRQDVDNGSDAYYHPQKHTRVEHRPAISVAGAFKANLSVADLTSEFEVTTRRGWVFVRYIGEGRQHES